MTTAVRAAPMSRAETVVLVSLVLAQVVLFLVPLVVLGGAIAWPASLRLPASEALSLIHANAASVQVGYVGYLLTAVAMVPLALAFRRHAQARSATGLLVDTMAALGIAAAVLKTLGILRWLVAMPALAALHVPAFNALGAVLPPLGLVWYLLLAVSLGRQGLRSKA